MKLWEIIKELEESGQISDDCTFVYPDYITGYPNINIALANVPWDQIDGYDIEQADKCAYWE